MSELNEKIFDLACELHGLEHGDKRALSSYEQIKQFLIENDLVEEKLVKKDSHAE